MPNRTLPYPSNDPRDRLDQDLSVRDPRMPGKVVDDPANQGRYPPLPITPAEDEIMDRYAFVDDPTSPSTPQEGMALYQRFMMRGGLTEAGLAATNLDPRFDSNAADEAELQQIAAYVGAVRDSVGAGGSSGLRQVDPLLLHSSRAALIGASFLVPLQYADLHGGITMNF